MPIVLGLIFLLMLIGGVIAFSYPVSSLPLVIGLVLLGAGWDIRAIKPLVWKMGLAVTVIGLVLVSAISTDGEGPNDRADAAPSEVLGATTVPGPSEPEEPARVQEVSETPIPAECLEGFRRYEADPEAPVLVATTSSCTAAQWEEAYAQNTLFFSSLEMICPFAEPGAPACSEFAP